MGLRSNRLLISTLTEDGEGPSQGGRGRTAVQILERKQKAGVAAVKYLMPRKRTGLCVLGGGCLRNWDQCASEIGVN